MSKALIYTVDDFALTHRHVSKVLSPKGYEVCKCMSAVECLQLLSSRMPDLLILDVEMPDIDGFQLCKKLKAYEKTADIPVIFLSASGSESAQEQMKEVGGEAFVRKPFLPAALISAVENALH